MFSAAQSLAPDLVKALHHADLERLPYCRGAIEASYRVDHTGFMVSGWAKDSTGVQTAQWIAAVLPDGTLIDTARALVPRYDLDGGDAADRTSVGFEAGFRLPATDRDDGSSPPQQKVAILGIFPGMPEQFCRMPALAPLGDIEIAPLPKLHGVSAVANVTMEQAIGFRMGESSDLIRAWPWPAGLRTWRLENGVSGATLRFTIPAGDVASLAIPFAMATPRQGQVSVSFLMQDGTSIASALPGMWSWVAWHAAVLNADISVRHGGVTAIEVTATGKPGLLVCGPIHAELSPEWSRVY